MIEFTLPWPPTALSSNSRLHWSKLAKAKNRYGWACWFATFGQKNKITRLRIPARIALDIEFAPPDRRSRDVDNMLARFKAGQDAMAEALNFNDSRIASITVRVASEPTKGGAVRVRLREEPAVVGGST